MSLARPSVATALAALASVDASIVMVRCAGWSGMAHRGDTQWSLPMLDQAARLAVERAGILAFIQAHPDFRSAQQEGRP
ncbi:MAG: hypothetical protein ACOCY0_04140 [Roseicyclus sp.]